MILAEVIVFYGLLFVINELHVFNTMAYVVMFGIGMIDNKANALTCVILGFEFESNITPFGAKSFYENLMVTLVVGILSISNLETKE